MNHILAALSRTAVESSKRGGAFSFCPMPPNYIHPGLNLMSDLRIFPIIYVVFSDLTISPG